jgi:glycyl-tRNA synthetase
MEWYLKLGIPKEKLNWHKHEKLAHYASDAYDIEYDFASLDGFKEVEGIHARGNWDLSQHAKFSGVDLSYFNEETKERFVPHIVETSAGLARHFLMFLDNAYTEVGDGDEKRVYLALHPKLAPIKCAVFPLLKNKPELVAKAKEVFKSLREEIMCEFDDNGNIGKRYRRQDEIGTPYCVVVDFDTLGDPSTSSGQENKDTVTIRNRNTGAQERILIKDILSYLRSKGI